MFRCHLYLSVSFFVCILAGCKSIGTVILPKNRLAYNSAVISSNEQQLLLNLVRIQCEDAPQFISIDNINASNSISYNGDITSSYSTPLKTSRSLSFNGIAVGKQLVTQDFSDSLSNIVPTLDASLNGGISYNDSPNVSFTPFQGEKYTRAVLSPINLDTLYMFLYSTRWHPGRLFRATVTQLGFHINNGEDIRPERIPKYKDFNEIADILDELERDDVIAFAQGTITEVSVEPEKDNLYND